MLERDVIAKTLRFAKQASIPSIRMHFAPTVQKGWPDYCFLIPGGKPLFIEFKATGGKPTPMQERQIGILRSQSYDVEVCDCPQKAIDAIKWAVLCAASDIKKAAK